MTCYYPIKGFQTSLGGFTTAKKKGYADKPMQIPCGNCIGCRLDKAQQWAMRCTHEIRSHEDNCFITLTYSPENLPYDGSLNVRHFQLFMKKLRKKYEKPIRFFHCGEYGEQLSRPHYHALLFGHDFEDKRTHSKTKKDNIIYTSDQLTELWGLGHCSIGDATFASAGYIARYTMKKIGGRMADDHYQGKKPEYITMSRNPGLGSDWIHKNFNDVYPHDFCVIDGRRIRPPAFYDAILKKQDEKLYDELKGKRTRRSKEHLEENTKDRLSVREQVKLAQTRPLTRNITDA